MKACCFLLGAMLAAAGARAQSLDEPAAPAGPARGEPQLCEVPAAPRATTPGMTRAQPLANVRPAPSAFQPYMGNAADSTGNAVMNANKAALGAWVTDPRLYAGIRLTPYLAIETGVANLYDRGTFYAGTERKENLTGAFASGGFNSYLAGKVTVPVTPRLEAYGKAGLAYSEIKCRDEHLVTVSDTDAGPYVGVGARYKLSEKASVSAGYERYGDSQKWGGASNNNGVSAKVKLGF